MIILQILFYVFTAYLSLSVLYLLFFSLSARFFNKTTRNELNIINKIAVFIPAYKEDDVILDTTKKALHQTYPEDKYDIIVIADSLQKSTLRELYRLPVKTIEVFFDKSTKTRALNKAMEVLDETYRIAVVLDADNVMAPDFLEKINSSYCSGNSFIQGHRIAKNKETRMSFLDGLSEEMNNTIFRKGHVSVGLSAALIGSAMAFDYAVFKSYMKRIKAIGGFDKELELLILKDRNFIQYEEDAYVFDEKVSDNKSFTHQRTRWISAQIRYAIDHFPGAVKNLLIKGNIDYFDKVLQFAMPPRVILLGLLSVSTLIALLTSISIFIYFLTLTGCLVLALVNSLPKDKQKSEIIRSAINVPVVFFLMVKAALGYRKAKTNFLHTPHKNH